ncbi:unnamed protein product, partial [Prorocentrum cordatum]
RLWFRGRAFWHQLVHAAALQRHGTARQSSRAAPLQPRAVRQLLREGHQPPGPQVGAAPLPVRRLAQRQRVRTRRARRRRGHADDAGAQQRQRRGGRHGE